MSFRRDARKLSSGIAALRPHARGEMGALTLGVLLGAASVALHLLRPWPLKWILDAIAGHTTRHHMVARWATEHGAVGSIALAASYVALTALLAAATYWQVLLMNGVGNRVMFRFRTALFAHVLRQPLAYHESRDTGELLTRIVYDTSRFRRGLNALVVSLPRTLLLFIGTIVVLMWLSPPLAAVLGVGAVAAFLTMHKRGRRVLRAAKKQRRKEGDVAALVADELQAVRELQTFGPAASPAQMRFARKNDRSLAGEQKVRKLAAGISARIELLFAFTIALTVLIATRTSADAFFSAGDVVLFLSYALSLQGPFDEFARHTGRFGRTAASASRLVKLAEREPEIVDAPNAVAAVALRGELAYEGVSLRAPRRVRGSRKWTLDDVWLQLPAGTRVAVVGGNGAGKSSLLRLALRLADPTDGRVLLDERDLREYAVASLRPHFSVVFQDAVLFGLSVRGNLTLGLPATDDEIAAAVRAAGADTLIERLPEKYDTIMRRRGGLLSPGERQRLAIARALLRNGRVWLLDEPTTSLDDEASSRLCDVLLSATSGRTTLWVSHDPALVQRLDMVVALEAGKVTFAGTPDEYTTRRADRALLETS